MKWITREHPKIDRIACPRLIRRFIDPEAEIIYVPYERNGIQRLALCITSWVVSHIFRPVAQYLKTIMNCTALDELGKPADHMKM